MTTIQILLGLLTIFGSGVVSAFVTYKLNTQRAEREFRRQKLEDCYDAMHHFCSLLGSSHLPFMQVNRQRLTWDQANEQNIELLKDKNGEHWRELEKLINIYFHPLKPSLEKLIAVRDSLSDCKTDVKKRFLAENLSPTQTLEYDKAFLHLDAVETEFKSEIFLLAQAIK